MFGQHRPSQHLWSRVEEEAGINTPCRAVAEAAEERQIPVALLIDELQYFNQKELSALIMAMHKLQQRQLPMVLLGAGLPILPGLAGESKSYAERWFNFPDIGALSDAVGCNVASLTAKM